LVGALQVHPYKHCADYPQKSVRGVAGGFARVEVFWAPLIGVPLLSPSRNVAEVLRKSHCVSGLPPWSHLPFEMCPRNRIKPRSAARPERPPAHKARAPPERSRCCQRCPQSTRPRADGAAATESRMPRPHVLAGDYSLTKTEGTEKRPPRRSGLSPRCSTLWRPRESSRRPAIATPMSSTRWCRGIPALYPYNSTLIRARGTRSASRCLSIVSMKRGVGVIP
jgi:hypothetical protein